MKFMVVMFVLAFFCFMPQAGILTGMAFAQSGQPTQFLTSLPDIPLMPGLIELSDQTVAFDKPSGRIVESALQIQRGSKDEIQLYYESVLPQFGWSRMGDNAFARGGERLQMSFEDYEDERFLRIMIIPQ